MDTRQHNEQIWASTAVKAEQIFEIGFEGVHHSKRHKCGYAVRFPRILRQRKDKSIEDINTVNDLMILAKN